jgi:hypothetical protein
MVVQSFRCLPQLRLAYLVNQKTASTTIKYSMLLAAASRSDSNPSDIRARHRNSGLFVENILKSPLFGSPEIRQMRVFSVVRNPFVRALSGYLQKIATNAGSWREFAQEFGFRAEVSGSALRFTEFLRLLDTQRDDRINRHFRPQYLNLLLPFSLPRFIGRLEQFDETARFLAEAGVSIEEQKGRPVNAGDRMEQYYTDEAVELVARKFAPDFALFGYSPKFSELRELLPPTWSGGPDLLLDWLSGGDFPIEFLDPVARAQHKILKEDDLDSTLARIESVYESETNARRLAHYAKFAADEGRSELVRRVKERIAALRDVHRACVENRDIFVPLETMYLPGKPTARPRRAGRKSRVRDSRS